MFERIITRFQQRKIRLKIDQLLQSGIAEKYKNNSPVDFSFSLFDFVYAIGTCRTVASTKANKFSLALDFLGIIETDSNELRVLINHDETIEQKQDISKYIGEGLSLVIAERLYNLEKSTISRIKRRRNESKPDFMGFTPLLKVVWEAKGSTGTIRQDEIAHAKEQKENEVADIAFVSLATLKSGSMTEVSLEDPPTLPLHGKDLKRELSKVMHYVNTFNFIGQAELSRYLNVNTFNFIAAAELSRYFKLLGKRLERDRDFPEFMEKFQLFEKIRNESIKVSIRGKTYLGNVERVGDSSFLYVGFDEKLLSIQDFLNFSDYEEEILYEHEENTFRITKDGICFGYLRNLGKLRDLGFMGEIDACKIPYYRDTLSMRDLDNMLHFQLVEHISYLFEREGFDVKKEVFEGNRRYDMIVSKEGKKFIVEVKKDVIIKSFEQIKGYQDANAALLITTMNVSDEDIRYAADLNIVIIDRKSLKAIIENQKKISDLLKKYS